jgi:hypothetical protein
MGWVVNATPRPLYRWEREPLPIVWEAVWAPWPVWMCVESFAFAGIQSTDHSDRSKSLYLLSYRGSQINIYQFFFFFAIEGISYIAAGT